MPLETLITGRIATLVGRQGVRLGRGDRDPRRSHRVRRVRDLPRDPRGSVHAAHPPGTRPGGDPRADRRAPAPRAGRDGEAPGRPDRRAVTRRWVGSAARRTRGPPARRLARGPRLGQRSMGWLADRGPARDRRTRSSCRAVGPRPPRHVGQSRRTGHRRLRCRRPAGRRGPSRARRDAGGRAVRGGHAARDDPRPATHPGRPRRRHRRGRARARVARRRRLPRSWWRRPRPGPLVLLPGLRAPRRVRPVAACACMHASATTPLRRRSGRATEAERPSGATRPAGRRSAGRSASPTARSGRARPRSWRTSSRRPIDRSRPTAAAASG